MEDAAIGVKRDHALLNPGTGAIVEADHRDAERLGEPTLRARWVHLSLGVGHPLSQLRSLGVDVRLALDEAIAAEIAQRVDAADEPFDEAANQQADARLAALQAEHERLTGRIARVPFIDEFDLRYNNRIPQPRPIAQAVMLCIMDVSGSMDENRKELAKRFFILLHLFLTRHYERIEIVFIRHHTTAAVVDEEGFFHSRESGGTLVSSALELALETIKERFPADLWNVYVAQASDGDNWESDCPKCHDLLVNELLPRVQYYTYVEIDAAQPQSLWEQYELARGASRNMALGRILGRADVYPVLRELFARKERMAA